MKLLVDTCVSALAVDELRATGHDVVWTGEWPTDPGDESILRTALDDERIVVTLGKDFGELAIVRRISHRGIIRLVNQSARLQAALCEIALRQYASELKAGAIVTVEPHRVRVRVEMD